MNLEEKKERFLLEFLKNAPFDGWSKLCIENTSEQLYQEPNYGFILFPNGIEDLAYFFSDYIDKTMLKLIERENLKTLKVRDKIKTLIYTRLELYQPYKLAIKKLLQMLYNPLYAITPIKILWRTSDKFWYIAGDQSTDFNYYTKRVILSCVYSKTLLYWLNDNSNNHQDTINFLDWQIDQVMRIGKVKNSFSNLNSRLFDLPFVRLIKRKFHS